VRGYARDVDPIPTTAAHVALLHLEADALRAAARAARLREIVRQLDLDGHRVLPERAAEELAVVRVEVATARQDLALWERVVRRVAWWMWWGW
jgi:hypothetical protein